MRPDLKYLSSFLFAVLFIIKISCFVDIVEMTYIYNKAASSSVTVSCVAGRM